MRKKLTEVIELFSVKNHMVCKGYYLDSVGGTIYIRPNTATLYQPINREQSLSIYKEASDLLSQRVNTRAESYARDYVKSFFTDDPDKFKNMTCNEILDFLEDYFKNTPDEISNCILNNPVKLLNNVDIFDVNNLLSKLMINLNQTDREVLDRRLNWLRKTLLTDTDVSNMQRVLDIALYMGCAGNMISREIDWSGVQNANVDNFDAREKIDVVIDTSYTDDIALASVLYDSNFKKSDVIKATEEFSTLGDMLKDYTYEQIYAYDFSKSELLKIGDMVMAFAHKYGLLGLLNPVFNISDDLFLTRVNIEDANVSTFMQTAYFAINKRGLAKSPMINLHKIINNSVMNISEYINIFFPNERFMEYFDEYKEMDGRYWSRYSEPLNLFLLAAKMFNTECVAVSKSDYTDSVPTQFKGIAMNLEYNEEFQATVYKFQFSSLFDAMRYCALYDSQRNPNTFLCRGCHRYFIKGNKKQRYYCDDNTCGGRYRAAKRYNKVKEQTNT